MSLSKTERAIITNVRNRLTWDRANFGGADGRGQLGSSQLDALVKERTRIYLDSWIIPALNLMLDEDSTNRRKDLDLAIRLTEE